MNKMDLTLTWREIYFFYPLVNCRHRTILFCDLFIFLPSIRDMQFSLRNLYSSGKKCLLFSLQHILCFPGNYSKHSDRKICNCIEYFTEYHFPVPFSFCIVFLKRNKTLRTAGTDGFVLRRLKWVLTNLLNLNLINCKVRVTGPFVRKCLRR